MKIAILQITHEYVCKKILGIAVPSIFAFLAFVIKNIFLHKLLQKEKICNKIVVDFEHCEKREF